MPHLDEVLDDFRTSGLVAEIRGIEVKIDDIPVDLDDQHDAAFHESVALMPSSLSKRERSRGYEDPDSERSALLVALCVYIMDRAREQCPHVESAMTVRPQPVWAAINGIFASCESCIVTRFAHVDHDLHHCHFCGDESDSFMTITWVIGPVTFFGDLCDRCHKAVDQELRV